MLYNEFKPSDVAYFQKFFDLFTEKGIFEQAGSSSTDCSTRADAWPMPAAVDRHALGRAATRRAAPREAAVGPVPAVRRAGAAVHRLGPGRAQRLHQADPAADAGRHAGARWSPGSPAAPLLADFVVTVMRTLEAFLIAAVIGVPLGVLLGSNEKRLPQRRVPDRLLPLDAVVGADPAVPADLRRVRHQQGRDRRVRRVADRRVQQRLRRDQRAQAARDGGQGDGRVALADLQGRADLGEPAADASSACAARCRWRW